MRSDINKYPHQVFTGFSGYLDDNKNISGRGAMNCYINWTDTKTQLIYKIAGEWKDNMFLKGVINITDRDNKEETQILKGDFNNNSLFNGELVVKGYGTGNGIYKVKNGEITKESQGEICGKDDHAKTLCIQNAENIYDECAKNSNSENCDYNAVYLITSELVNIKDYQIKDGMNAPYTNSDYINRARVQLGLLYAQGLGVEKDKAKALNFWQLVLKNWRNADRLQVDNAKKLIAQFEDYNLTQAEKTKKNQKKGVKYVTDAYVQYLMVDTVCISTEVLFAKDVKNYQNLINKYIQIMMEDAKIPSSEWEKIKDNSYSDAQKDKDYLSLKVIYGNKKLSAVQKAKVYDQCEVMKTEHETIMNLLVNAYEMQNPKTKKRDF